MLQDAISRISNESSDAAPGAPPGPSPSSSYRPSPADPLDSSRVPPYFPPMVGHSSSTASLFANDPSSSAGPGSSLRSSSVAGYGPPQTSPPRVTHHESPSPSSSSSYPALHHASSPYTAPTARHQQQHRAGASHQRHGSSGSHGGSSSSSNNNSVLYGTDAWLAAGVAVGSGYHERPPHLSSRSKPAPPPPPSLGLDSLDESIQAFGSSHQLAAGAARASSYDPAAAQAPHPMARRQHGMQQHHHPSASLGSHAEADDEDQEEDDGSRPVSVDPRDSAHDLAASIGANNGRRFKEAALRILASAESTLRTPLALDDPSQDWESGSGSPGSDGDDDDDRRERHRDSRPTLASSDRRVMEAAVAPGRSVGVKAAGKMKKKGSRRQQDVHGMSQASRTYAPGSAKPLKSASAGDKPGSRRAAVAGR